MLGRAGKAVSMWQMDLVESAYPRPRHGDDGRLRHVEPRYFVQVLCQEKLSQGSQEFHVLSI